MTLKYYANKITGLSTDTKPNNVREGFEFFETDTKNTFMYINGFWIPKDTNKDSFYKLRLAGVDLHGNLINRENGYRNKNNVPDGYGIAPEGSNFYDWTFQELSTVDNYPVLIRLNFTWEAYTRNNADFLKELDYIVRVAQQYNTLILFDFFQGFTGSLFYSFEHGNPDATQSSPFRGMGFPSKYLQYYYNTIAGYDPNTNTGSDYARNKAFWADFYANQVKDANGNVVNIWDDFVQFFRLIVQRTRHVAYGYEFINEAYIFTYDPTSTDPKLNQCLGLRRFYEYVYNNTKDDVYIGNSNKPIYAWGKPVFLGKSTESNSARVHGGDYYAVPPNSNKWLDYVPTNIPNSMVVGHVYAEPSLDPTSQFYKRLRAYSYASSRLAEPYNVLITEHNITSDSKANITLTDDTINKYVDYYKNWYSLTGIPINVKAVCWYVWQNGIAGSLTSPINLQRYDTTLNKRVFTNHGEQFKKFIKLFR